MNTKYDTGYIMLKEIYSSLFKKVFTSFFYVLPIADVFSEQQVIRTMTFPFAYCSN